MSVSASGAETPDQEGMEERPTVKSLVRSDASLPFYSFAIRVVPDRDIFMEETVLWEKAIWKWLQILEILGFPGMLGHAWFLNRLTLRWLNRAWFCVMPWA